MVASARVRSGLMILAVVCATACATTTPPKSQPAASAPGATDEQPHTAKRIVATTLSELRVLILRENFAVAGKAEVQGLVAQGLTGLDEKQELVPVLAEAVPSVENGLWKVLPDGRMETTWHIRDGAKWQDGEPFTADDLVFTGQVIRDKDMADLYNNNYSLIDDVTAVDPRTVKVTWSKAYIDADQLFGIANGVPLPKHLLEQPYNDDKMSLSSLPYWTSGFVGTGPFKVKDWTVGGGQMILSANDSFILGRPKIDEVEVRMLTDNSTMLANILAGQIDVTMGRNLSFEQAQTVRNQWTAGTIRVGASANPMIIYPSFLYTDPLIIRDVRFRRALLQAINRQEMADTLIPGLSSVADSVVAPSDPDYPHVQSGIVKYSFDPKASVQAIEGLGYTRGPDGMFRDATGQPLSVEIRTTSDNEIHMAAFYPLIDYIKAVGVGVDPVVIPPARQRDVEYRAKMPGFQYTQGAEGLSSLVNYTSPMQETAENGYRGNHTGYANPDYDAIVDKYMTTIPKTERYRAATDALHHMTDQLVVMTTFFNTQPQAVANRLKNVPENASPANIYQWDVE